MKEFVPSNLKDASSTYLDTPVALFIFKRPKETKLVLEAISRARPKRLYIIADGVSPSSPLDAKLVEETREIISEINWDCQVSTNFSDKQQGLRQRFSSGLDWVFAHEETAIILEDDCLPSIRFFSFASELLDLYKFDHKVAGVCGTNLSEESGSSEFSYFFSRYPSIWGWATWKRAWIKYKPDIPRMTVNQVGEFVGFSPNKRTSRYWSSRFNIVSRRQLDTWDYQLAHLSMIESSLWVIPSKNLVSNIGFGSLATHTINPNSQFANLPLNNPTGKLLHQSEIRPNEEYDNWLRKTLHVWNPWQGAIETTLAYLPSSLKFYIKNLVARILFWSSKN